MSARWRSRSAAAFVAAAVLTGRLALPARLAGQEYLPSDSAHHGPTWLPEAAAALAVAATLPLDGHVRNWIQGAPRQDNMLLRHTTDVVTPLGAEVPFVAGAVLYAYARISHHSGLADAMWHTGEGTVAASVLTLALKAAVHRTRPYVAPHDPWTFFQGPVALADSPRESFPSGHTTVAFAVAAAGTEEVRIHWPDHTGLAAVGLYGLATGVAFARVYDDRHWASDVVAGAAVGTLVSRAVVRRAHRHDVSAGGGNAPQLVVIPGWAPTVGVRIPLR